MNLTPKTQSTQKSLIVSNKQENKSERYFPYIERVFWPVYSNWDDFLHLLEMTKRRAAINEICYFTEGDGGDFRFLKREEIVRRSEYLTRIVSWTKSQGFRASINILNTLAHSDEGDRHSPIPEWRTMVGSDGLQAKFCACPSDPAFLEYAAFKYRQFSLCNADAYWMDDDIRMIHHQPVKQGCFCDACIRDFEREVRCSFPTRDTFVSCLQGDLDLRTEWAKRNTKNLKRLIRDCLSALRTHTSNSTFGIMIGNPHYNQDLITGTAGLVEEVFDGSSTGTIAVRVGGGFWSDERPRDILIKMLDVAITTSQVNTKASVFYEVENYPFTRIGKSSYATGIETLLAILTGKLDGVMFDVLELDSTGLDARRKWMDDLDDFQQLWIEGLNTVQGTSVDGWTPVFSEKHWIQKPLDEPLFPSKDYGQYGLAFLQLCGIPVTGLPGSGFLLSERSARSMNRVELESLFLKPIIIDAGAASHLIDIGLGKLIAAKSYCRHDEGTVEIFTESELNDGHKAYKLRATGNYFGSPRVSFDPSPKAKVLSNITSFSGQIHGAGVYIFETGETKGAVLGSLAEPLLLRPPRRTQWRNISKSLLPNVPTVESDYPIVCWVRRIPNSNSYLLVLLNAGQDYANDIRIQGTTESVTHFARENAFRNPINQGEELHLPPWGICIVKVI